MVLFFTYSQSNSFFSLWWQQNISHFNNLLAYTDQEVSMKIHDYFNAVQFSPVVLEKVLRYILKHFLFVQ